MGDLGILIFLSTQEKGDWRPVLFHILMEFVNVHPAATDKSGLYPQSSWSVV